jgi:hypothetical protein
MLARRLFDKARDADFDTLLAGPLCCHGLRDFATTACRATTRRPTPPSFWTEGATPIQLCRNRW